MINFAQIKDIDEVMGFIDEEWRKNHILARDKDFFSYMYVMEDKVNFIISRDSGTNKINGILGYVAYDKDYRQISLTVWKALRSSDGMIGIAMLNFLLKELNPQIIASPGINPKTTIPLYKLFGFQIGKMNHFYRLADIDKYNIAVINSKKILAQPKSGDIIEINSFDDFKKLGVHFAENALKKEDWYINQRYFKHPKYTYKVFAVAEGEEHLAVFAREQQMGDYKCLRIVDLIGKYSLLLRFTEHFDNEMKINGYEYVDCYASGIDEEIFKGAGWEDIETGENIIPNYFAPFEQQNVNLFFSSKPANVVMLRGDSDQDRPN